MIDEPIEHLSLTETDHLSYGWREPVLIILFLKIFLDVVNWSFKQTVMMEQGIFRALYGV